MHEHNLLALAAIFFIGICCQWLAQAVKLPAIIFLLLSGIAAGPVLGLLHPDELFGPLLFPTVSLGVAVILFEGGLTLKLHQLKELARPIILLLSLGVLVSWGITAVAARYIMHFSWDISLLFGALMTVTGPTVIKPLIKSIRPNARIAHILHWESILLDPIGAILTVLVFQFVVLHYTGQAIALTSLVVIATGVIMGIAGALVLAAILKRHLVPYDVHHIFALGFVLLLFALSEAIHSESGLLAVPLMGMILANMKGVDIEEILYFKESLTILLISTLFIILAARLQLEPLIRMGWPSLLLLAVILFVARPASVYLSTLGSGMNWKEKALLSWVAPRGIVAASVAALFALRLEGLGSNDSEILVPVTFLVIIATVLIQGLTARPLAKKLELTESEANGILIAGANRLARSIAHALEDQDYRVLLADTGWGNISAARMEGLDVYHGQIVSEHADRSLPLGGVGTVLCLSAHSAVNQLVAARFKAVVGPQHIYHVQTSVERKLQDEKTQHSSFSSEMLFGDDVTQYKLITLLREGAAIRTTSLSKQFTFSDYRQHNGGNSINLWAIDPDSKIHFFTSHHSPAPRPGWKVVSLFIS